MRSLETGKAFGSEKFDPALIAQKLNYPHAGPAQLHSLRDGSVATAWINSRAYLHRSLVPAADKEVVDLEQPLSARRRPSSPTRAHFRAAKRYGISDAQLAQDLEGDDRATQAAQVARR